MSKLFVPVPALFFVLLTVACGSSGVVGPSSPISVTPTADIKANGFDGPITIATGTAAILTWTSTNANACVVSPGGFLGTSGSASTGNLTTSQAYIITCVGVDGQTAGDVVIVNVI